MQSTNCQMTVNKILRVKKILYCDDELKTKTSYRTLPLIPGMKKELLEHKAKIEENKKFFGEAYDKRYFDYVFVNPDGRIIYPDWLSHSFAKMLKRNNLKHIRLHDLRHSCASLLLANGIPLKQIQEWLGHADFATTADVYSHMDFSAKVQSATVIERSFRHVEQKPDTAKEQKSDVERILDGVKREMAQLGFNSYDEYFSFLSEQSGVDLGDETESADKNLLTEKDEMIM